MQLWRKFSVFAVVSRGVEGVVDRSTAGNTVPPFLVVHSLELRRTAQSRFEYALSSQHVCFVLVCGSTEQVGSDSLLFIKSLRLVKTTILYSTDNTLNGTVLRRFVYDSISWYLHYLTTSTHIQLPPFFKCSYSKEYIMCVSC